MNNPTYASVTGEVLSPEERYTSLVEELFLTKPSQKMGNYEKKVGIDSDQYHTSEGQALLNAQAAFIECLVFDAVKPKHLEPHEKPMVTVFEARNSFIGSLEAMGIGRQSAKFMANQFEHDIKKGIQDRAPELGGKSHP